MSLCDVIQDMPMFRDFSGRDLKKFAEMEHNISEYQKGETIIEEGANFTSIYLLLMGNVKIVKKMDGHTILLARLKPGEIFGEMSFFSKKRRHSGAVACEGVRVLKMGEDFFEQAGVSIKDKLKNYFIELLINRLDAMNESIMAVSKLMRLR